jgi:CRP-like cAMP-binding protein
MRIDSLIESLGSAVTRRDLKAGDFIHHQGDFAETVSFIQTGQVVVEAYAEGSWEAHPVRFVGPQGMIGEEALGQPDALRCSTVRALCDVRLGVVYRDELADVMSRSATSARLVVGLLVAGLHSSQRALLAGIAGSANQRVTRLLLHADDTIVGTSGSTLHLTQQDLARLAGLQRPTANRVLRDLQQCGLIELRRGRVRVLDRPQMERSLALDG